MFKFNLSLRSRALSHTDSPSSKLSKVIMDATSTRPPNVVLVPTPGIGHLIPLVELAKRLVHHHSFSATFIVPNDGSPMELQKQLLNSLPTSISSLFLPPVNFDDLPQDVRIETRITLSLTRSLQPLRDAFKALTESTRVVALVVDIFGPDAIGIAKEFGYPSFLFFPTTALGLSLVFHLPKLHETTSCEYRDLPEPVKFPGCVPVKGSDLADPVMDRKDDAYKWILHICNLYPSAAGIMVNSFMDLEPGGFKALMEDEAGIGCIPPIYPVGPLTQTNSSAGGDGDECLKWLDEQPSRSVLFVCFGSGGTLSHDQLNELAMGLEMSGQRFLWVVKPPHDGAANATYFGAQNGEATPFDFLPEGFMGRTRGVGLVVSAWAPQAQVLSHSSTGGFLTHCGWNSISESIVNGVPLIAWPLYAEQRMNAALMCDDLKVAWRVKAHEKGIVPREQIANYARAIFEGEEGELLRTKMGELKSAAARALSPDGSSTKSLAEVARIWKGN